MKLTFAPHTLQFKRLFSIAHGARSSTPVVFTQIESDGVFGYGEASMPPYLGEDHRSVLQFLEKAAEVLRGFSDAGEPGPILEAVDSIAPGNTAAKAALDIALHDLWGKQRNQPCHQLFGVDNTKPLFTAYTIPIDDAPGIKNRIEEAKDYKILKIKLGTADDKHLIEEIRKNTDKPFFVDVNEGWTDKHFALEMMNWLAGENCLFAEQPMPKEQMDDIAWLTERAPMPVIADEGVQRLADVEKAKGVYNGINIKLMKCTGLYEALKMIRKAREQGMKIMLGCMSESSCGVSAAAQIAPLVDWIDLDGPLLIKEDFFSDVKFSEGKILLSDAPGIGVEPVSGLFK